jgi:hypothetical protein
MSHVLRHFITAETKREHRARWFVYAGGNGAPLEKIRWQSTMRGHWPGYDAECSCGWASKTGGATKASVEDALWDHRFGAQSEQAHIPMASPGARTEGGLRCEGCPALSTRQTEG